MFDLNELDEWEDRILWGDAPSQQYVYATSLKLSLLPRTDRVSKKIRVATFPNPLKHRNALFDEGDWVKSVLWDGENPARAEYFTRLNLNLNDTQMLLEVQRAQGALSISLLFKDFFRELALTSWLSRNSRRGAETDRSEEHPRVRRDARPARRQPRPVQPVERQRVRGPERAEAADYSTDVWGSRSRARVSGAETPVALCAFSLNHTLQARRH